MSNKEEIDRKDSFELKLYSHIALEYIDRKSVIIIVLVLLLNRMKEVEWEREEYNINLNQFGAHIIVGTVCYFI